MDCAQEALEATRLGAQPEAKALFEARDQFYRDAEQLAQNPSPELGAGEALAARDRALIKQERALLAQPGANEVARNRDTDPHAGARSTAATDSHEAARAPTTRDTHGTDAGDTHVSRSRETPRAHDDPHASRAEVPHTHDDAPKLSPAPVYETRAEMIPGSTFTGRGGSDRGTEVLADARTALVELVRSSRDASISMVDANSKLVGDGRARAEQTFILMVPGRAEAGRSGTPPPERFTIRIATGPLAGNTVARTIVNPTQRGLTPTAAAPKGRAIRGRYVIQLSNRLDATHVKRAVAHELAEIRAIRELVDDGRHAGPDALGRGARGQELSPNDRGRLAEVEVLAQQLAARDTNPAAREAARRELIALADHLGLLDADPASRARFEHASSGLGKRGREALGEVRRSTGEGQSAHDELSATRTRATKDRSDEAERAHANRPAHDMPSGLDEHGHPLAGPELDK